MNKFSISQGLLFGIVLVLLAYQTVNYVGSRQTVIKFLPILSKFQTDPIKKPLDSKKDSYTGTANRADSSS